MAAIHKPEIIKAIKRNYLNMQQALIEELFMSIEEHAPTLGSHREQIWKHFFERILPKKFTVEQSAFIIDSSGKVSKETDLVVFDEQYMPYIFRNRNIKYIPIEAVMAVVQCKSTSFRQSVIESLTGWLDSFDGLEPSKQGWAGTVTPNVINKNNDREIRPLRIVCGLFNAASREMEKFIQNHNCHLLICANQDSGNDSLSIYRKHATLFELISAILPNLTEMQQETLRKEYFAIPTNNWNIHQNKNAEHELIGLLTLVFELNQYLMCINNPMLFPHRAYVAMFNHEDCNLADVKTVTKAKQKPAEATQKRCTVKENPHA